MDFKTLETTDKDIIRHALNLGFSDYSIPLQFNPEQWEQKIKAENIKWEWSVGAFDGDTLVGVMVHGEKKSPTSYIAYNAGTSVIPSHRGQKLTRKMYDFLIPRLKSASFDNLILEVIADNFPAITSYEAVGYQTIRKFESFRGNIHNPTVENDFKVVPLQEIDWPLLQSFWDITPSWQNDVEAVENIKDELSILGLFRDEAMLGYVVFNPLSNKISQIAVSREHRRQKIAATLLHTAIKDHDKPVIITNVDRSNQGVMGWLEALGVPHFVSLNEMVLNL